MAEVIDFTSATTLSLDPDRVLEAAKGKMESVVVIGFTLDGAEYFASSDADGADVLWHLERAKHRLMRTIDEGVIE